MSFNIPLPGTATLEQVKEVETGDPIPAECDDGVGTAASVTNPEADKGWLCVFMGASESGEAELLSVVTPEFGGGAIRAGAGLLVGTASASPDAAIGSWAVTAP
jgi:hypothetical protein